MSSEAICPITLTVAGDPRLARLVRMTAANVGALCSMSVDRIEDIRMAAEEAFIFGCTAVDSDDISIKFDVDESHVGMTFTFGDQATVDEDDQAAVYAELILASVCDSYEKTAAPLTLSLDLKADI